MSNVIRQVLGLGAAAAAYWMCKESYKGSVGAWEQKFQAHETDAMYDYTGFGWGHYSGQPTMDHWSHKLFGVKLFGLFGSKISWNYAKTYADGFMNDVLLKNLLPIAVGIGGLYATFGTSLHTPFRLLSRLTVPTPLGSALRNGANQLARLGGMAVNGLVNGAVNMMSRGGWGSVALAAVAGLGALRFWQVHKHIEQHELFRDFVSGADGH